MRLKGVYEIVEHVLRPMLSTPVDKNKLPSYLTSPGTTPFFTGLGLIGTPELCATISELVEDRDGDTETATMNKALLKISFRLGCGQHTKSDDYLVYICRCPVKAVAAIKKLVEHCGLKFDTRNGEKVTSRCEVEALCECCKRKNPSGPV